jgi:hypothetical protein
MGGRKRLAWLLQIPGLHDYFTLTAQKTVEL